MPEDFLALRGRRFLITGGSGGIGRATAVSAARHGALVAITGRDEDRLEATRAELAGEGHVAFVADLLEPASAQDAVRRASDAFGGVDAVVHAAGVHSARPLKVVDAAHVADVLAANVTSALLLAQAFRDARVKKVDGTLVLLSSVMATVGQPGVAVYAASKGAISAVTRSLALELVRDGIRVNAIEAGIVSTPLTDGIREAVGATAFEAIAEAHPLGLGTPDDIARPILFLSSPASAWMTGSSLVVDGGYTSR